MPADSRRGQLGESCGGVATAGHSRGLRELTEAKELRRTLVLACLDARFSWCLSRRLRNRDMPFIMVVVVGGGETHSRPSRLSSSQTSPKDCTLTTATLTNKTSRRSTNSDSVFLTLPLAMPIYPSSPQHHHPTFLSRALILILDSMLWVTLRLSKTTAYASVNDASS